MNPYRICIGIHLYICDVVEGGRDEGVSQHLTSLHCIERHPCDLCLPRNVLDGVCTRAGEERGCCIRAYMRITLKDVG